MASITSYKKEYRTHSFFNETIAEWTNIDRTCNDCVSVEVEMVYVRFHRVQFCKNISGHDLEEEYGDDDLEYFLTIEGNAVQKLAGKFSARDGKTLAKRIAERFAPYGQSSFDEIKKFLDKKDIEYCQSMY